MSGKHVAFPYYDLPTYAKMEREEPNHFHVGEVWVVHFPCVNAGDS